MNATRRDRWTELALFVLGFLALLLTEKAAGFVRDESVYFSAGENHWRWFQLLASSPRQAFTDEAITRSFSFNFEHPALMKNLFGLSFGIFHEKLGLFRPAAAFRLPAFFMGALALPFIYALGRRYATRAVGLAAAVSFLLVPRQFFEAHLACFDVPIATLWLTTVYFFWRSQETRWGWAFTGLSFGLALAAKHNAFFLPAVLVPFGLYRGWTASKDNPRARTLFLQASATFAFGAVLYGALWAGLGPDRFLARWFFLSPQTGLFLAMAAVGTGLCVRLSKTELATFRATSTLVAMAVGGPVVWYLHWPYLWHHPVERAATYFAFHAKHEHYAWFYLGELLREPPFPWSYVVVKTALTVPTSLFVPMVLGLLAVTVAMVRRKASMLDVLIAANAVASIAIISHPQVPHFGGVKHWFPAMPFLAILGAVSVWRGAQALSTWAGPRLPASAAFAGLCVLCAAPAAIASVRVYPYGTSHYSELAGGLPGAATLGMQRQFWANNVTGVLDWLNANAKQGARVYFHECHGGQINDYRRNKMVRDDLNFVGDSNSADIVAYQYHQEFREHEFNVWQAFGTTKPAFGLYVDETPQVIVYVRP